MRVPDASVRAMAPREAAAWLRARLDDGGGGGGSAAVASLEGRAISGARLLAIADIATSPAEAAAALGVKLAAAKLTQLAVRRGVATPADALREKAAELLRKSLAAAPRERPATASWALRLLEVRRDDVAHKDLVSQPPGKSPSAGRCGCSRATASRSRPRRSDWRPSTPTRA